MIQIYNQTNTNFDKNGDMVINPVSCTLDTSTWELSLIHLIDDEKWKYITECAVIKAPSFNGEQLFRIYDIVKNDSQIEVKAKPIFFDSKDDCTLIDVRPTNKNGQDALNVMTSGSKYSGESNITRTSTSYYVLKNLLEAITSDDENSFINRWGGEVMYDNYKVIINDKLGSDRGVSLLYGKNIAIDGLSEEVDMSETVTRIIPKSFNGYTLSGNQPWVDSTLINNYPKIMTKVIEYSDVKLKEDAQSDEEGVIVCDTLDQLRNELIKKCNAEFTNEIDKPKITINASMILLKNTTEYENYKVLEDVSLGDVIYCQHDKLGIKSTARVIDLIYDCVLDCVDSVTIGQHSYDFLNDVSSVINSASQVINQSNNTLMADKVKGILNLLNTSLRAQKDVAQRQDVRAILFEDLDTSSSTFGALCIGTQGIQIARRRNGANTDWIWGTAIDFQTIYANFIIAGTISDKLGNNSWNLDTGELTTKNMRADNAEISGVLNGAIINGGTINGTTINTDKSLTVGDNVYVGQNQSSLTFNNKTIYFTNDTYINRYRINSTGLENLELMAKDLIRVGKSGSTVGAELQSWPSEGMISMMVSGNGVMNINSISMQKEYLSLVTNFGTAPINIIPSGQLFFSKQPTIGSDRRLKENIKDIDLTSLLDVCEIKSFNYRVGKKQTAGFIAQDFMEHPLRNYVLSCSKYPIKRQKNGKFKYKTRLTVNYDVLYLASIQKVQQQEKRINDLERRLSKLENLLMEGNK